MSLIGAMSTAISGLNAQSAAFTNISDDVANSQTTGFKGVDTSFVDYLTTSTATTNVSGSVATRPDYLNNVQGSISQSSDPLALAIDGQGFFAVSEQNGTSANNTPTFSQQQYYTRAGDFTLDANGYLQNSAGEYLNGYSVNPTTGVVNNSTLAPISVAQTQFQPIASTQISLVANVPATPGANSNLSSQVSVYDATGTAHQMTTSWTQTSANNWTLTLSSPDDQTGPTTGTVNVTFGADGTIQSLQGATGNIAVNGAGSGAGTAASVTLTPTFNGTSAISAIRTASRNSPARIIRSTASTRMARRPDPSPAFRPATRALSRPTTTMASPSPSPRCRSSPSPIPMRCSGKTARRLPARCNRGWPLPRTRIRTARVRWSAVPSSRATSISQRSFPP